MTTPGARTDTASRVIARQQLSAELPARTVFEALRKRMGDAAALRTMRELLAEDRAAAEARALAKQRRLD
jgi:hypothetical protein